jgi:hypothetical protein
MWRSRKRGLKTRAHSGILCPTLAWHALHHLNLISQMKPFNFPPSTTRITRLTLILVFGGYLLGEEYSRIATQIKPLSYIVLALLIAAVGYFIWKRVIGSTHDDEL